MKKQITQSHLSETIGIALRTYQCYEEGRREPNFKTLIALADILEVTTDYLLGRTEE